MKYTVYFEKKGVVVNRELSYTTKDYTKIKEIIEDNKKQGFKLIKVIEEEEQE